MKGPSLKLATMFIQGHLFPLRTPRSFQRHTALEQENDGRNFVGIGLKIQRSKHFQFHVVHVVGRCWMPAVGH